MSSVGVVTSLDYISAPGDVALERLTYELTIPVAIPARVTCINVGTASALSNWIFMKKR